MSEAPIGEDCPGSVDCLRRGPQKSWNITSNPSTTSSVWRASTHTQRCGLRASGGVSAAHHGQADNGRMVTDGRSKPRVRTCDRVSGGGPRRQPPHPELP